MTLEALPPSHLPSESATLTTAQTPKEPILSSVSGTSDLSQPQLSQPQRPNSVLKVFCSTFLTIFLAELGDKTQLTTLLMSAESHAPWTVFAGAGTALVATSLIGVWLGCWLAKRVSPKTLETGAGVLLLLVATQLLWDIVNL